MGDDLVLLGLVWWFMRLEVPGIPGKARLQEVKAGKTMADVGFTSLPIGCQAKIYGSPGSRLVSGAS